MPKKAKGKKEGKTKGKSDGESKGDDVVDKPFEAPGASEKEITLRSEWVLDNAHHVSLNVMLAAPIWIKATRIGPGIGHTKETS